ncbi:hypothetical protein [Isoptericola sediminis]|uniref:Uncharacterized protein n=1 Tax=Isoptericola sediminis TaxID=2733572 RepID=A0A849JXD9_9MICO|nr:hypothetical protein [Isoptericola sediminis]NNU27976.1 hypothetical protein [Isoptericola sediminis]
METATVAAGDYEVYFEDLTFEMGRSITVYATDPQHARDVAERLLNELDFEFEIASSSRVS